MVLASLALLALFQAQTLTLTATARPVGAVLAEASKQLNVQLTANEEANWEIVLVSVDHMPLKGFMDRIAGVTACEWKPTEKGFLLRPSVSARQKEKQQVEQRFADRIRQGLAAALKIIAEGDSAPDNEKITNPGEIAITTLVSLIDAKEIAAIPPGNRIVWATAHANKMQLPMDGDAQAVVDQWVASFNIGLKKQQDDAAQAGGEAGTGGTAGTAGAATASAGGTISTGAGILADSGGAYTPSEPISRPVYKTDVAIGTERELGFTVTATAYDAKGNVLLQAEAPIYDVRMRGGPDDGSGPAKPDSRQVPIVLSKESQELNDAVGHFRNGTKLPPQIFKIFSHPEQYDPLGFGCSDALLTLAVSKHRQIVADIPDYLGSPGFARSKLLGEFLSQSSLEISTVDDGACLVIKPLDPVESRGDRLPRRAMRELIHKEEQKGFVTLDDVADLANRFPGSQPSSLYRFLARYVVPEANSGTWDYLRFYGSLSDPQRRLLWSQGTIPFRGLSEDQVARLEDALFDGDSQFDNFHAVDLSPSQTAQSAADSGADYRNEPTEVMPNGVPVNGSCTGQASSQPHLKFLDSSGSRMPALCSPITLARQRFLGEHPNLNSTVINYPLCAVAGERRQLTLNLLLAPHAYVVGNLFDYSFPSDAPKVDLAHLPPALQELVDRQFEAMEKSYQESVSLAGDEGQAGATPP